jgi:hypothetical protein
MIGGTPVRVFVNISFREWVNLGSEADRKIGLRYWITLS